MSDFNDLDSDVLQHHTLMNQIVKLPTRGDSVLDKILTDLDDLYMEPTISAPVSTSAHSIIYYQPHNATAPMNPTRTSFRPFRDSSVWAFGQWITEMDWSMLYGDDPDDMAAAFHQLINDQYKKYFQSVLIRKQSRFR